MSSSSQKRTRSERVAALALPPGQWERVWRSLRRRDVLGRMGLALLAAVATCVVIRGWDPPLGYRTGYRPPRDVVAKVSFTKGDAEATRLARQRARSRIRYVYVHDNRPLVELRAELRNKVIELSGKQTVAEVPPRLWEEFAPAATADPQQQFREFREAFARQDKMEQFEAALATAFLPFEQRGILGTFAQPYGNGDQEEILVHPPGRAEERQTVKVSDVLIGDGTALHESLLAEFQSAEVADRLFAWIEPRLAGVVTLKIDEQAGTKEEMDKATGAVKGVVVRYTAGQSVLAGAGVPLEETGLLRAEYEAILAQRSIQQRVVRAVAVAAAIFALFVLCGIYMRYRRREPLARLTHLIVILVSAVAAVALARLASHDAWQAEIIPLMLFGMAMAIAYRQELALLFSGVLALILVLAIGQGLHAFLLLLAVTTAANLNMGQIRSRSKLVYIGVFAGGVAVLLEIAMGMIDNRPIDFQLLYAAGRNGVWAVAAGFLMTGLLPFIERLFGVLTDLSLLELGDVAHPLLQELVRRAPSTYNHSITVGTIAEAAAESIGARGLLVRVGAYFHDIGKMLKPGYFAENRGSAEDRHRALVPAMSTLVIIAHIKDGSDLARQHRLPQPIIDLIVQHHGTTLVEFFYKQASQQQQADPNGGEVDESTYRYPGPKPQTKEAAVLMLADAVESASRTLIDPTPARIEGLVRELAESRLRNGQFDESGLTLRELRTIEKSMVMSLTSIYHGRIKYPDQRTA